MKNMGCMVAAAILAFSFTLSGCGGGGGDGSGGRGDASQNADQNAAQNADQNADQPQASSHAVSEPRHANGHASVVPGCASTELAAKDGLVAAPKPICLNGRRVRGLDNNNGSCFINAALQVIAHDDVLRKRVLNANAAPEIHTFFTRYDQAELDLTQAHANLVKYIRDAGHMPPGGGFTEVVLDLLDAGYTAMHLQETGAIVTYLDAGTRHFNVSAVSDQLRRRFDGMPDNARIKHFIYYQGGHYLSYLRDGERWIEADDARVKVVDVTTITALPNRPIRNVEYSGIAFAGYQ